MSPDQAYALWENVLETHVDDQGRINFEAVRDDPESLNGFVYWLASNGPLNSPAQYPTQEAQLAYHINAYNALAMHGAIDYGLPKAFSFFKRVQFFLLRKVQLDGRRISLYAYENDVIRKIPDPRLHVALNCMAVSCPRLPQEAFYEESLDQQLDAAAREFYNSRKHVFIDADREVVRLSEILDFYTDDFLLDDPNLISYVNRYAEPPIPGHYKQKFLDYDWTLNRQ